MLASRNKQTTRLYVEPQDASNTPQTTKRSLSKETVQASFYNRPDNGHNR